MRDSCSAAADVLLHQLFIHPAVKNSSANIYYLKTPLSHICKADAGAFIPE
jgi:hypothetical protein